MRRERRGGRRWWLVAVVLGSPLALAARGQSTQPAGPVPIDACGVLVQGRECVLFQGGGGKYYLSEYGRFRAGDAVRVIGTVDPNCNAICSDADSCISGAEVYDPVSFPCGQPVRVPFDPCSGVMIPSLAAGAGLALVAWKVRGRDGERG